LVVVVIPALRGS